MMNRRMAFTLVPVITIAVILLAFMAADSHAGKKGGKSWLGVYIQSVDDDLADALDLKVTKGVLVDDVIDDSPAEEAGVKAGDVIVKFNGKDVKNEKKLRLLIKNTSPEDKVDIVVNRDGKDKKMKIVVGESKSDTFTWITGDDDWGDKNIKVMLDKHRGPQIGVMIEDLSDQLGEYFGVKDGDGVLVKEVIKDSPAEKAGIKAGDVIIKAEGKDVYDGDRLRKVISKKEFGEKVKITVLRDKKRKDFSVELSEEFSSHDSGHSSCYSFHAPNYIELPDIPEFEFKHQYNDELKASLKELKEELKELKFKLQEELKDIDVD
ncbi:MAG: PDZ domain-containing protein [candidate division Zixibacteria bacterium]|nr:PDZ domain-containing protein [candidate division Zixibacteria bacterium]